MMHVGIIPTKSAGLNDSGAIVVLTGEVVVMVISLVVVSLVVIIGLLVVVSVVLLSISQMNVISIILLRYL